MVRYKYLKMNLMLKYGFKSKQLIAFSMTSGVGDKTLLLGSVGAQFYLTKDQRIEAKLMNEQLRYNYADYKNVYVNYTIGSLETF